MAPRPSTEDPARRHRAQRGDMLLEAVIALLITCFLGIGLTYAASRGAVAQRSANVHTLTVMQLRALMDSEGFAKDCAGASTTTTKTLTVAAATPPSTLSKVCTVQARNVTVNGTAKTVNVPHVEFGVTDANLLGEGNTLVLKN